MKDTKTLAYINLFGILGSIPKLCRECSEAYELIKNDKISLGFKVKNGPSATLVFNNGECHIVEGVEKCNILLAFSTCEKFNGMIDGTVTPIPRKGLLRVGFLLKKFMPLTDILSKYLRATDDDLKDSEFFRVSTLLMFNVITEAMAQIGNHDKIGQASASYIVNGDAKIAINSSDVAYINADNHKLTAFHRDPDDFDAYMIFESLELARALFDGKINAVTAVGLGQVRIGGMISMVDNLNRILDRVSFYLA
ncbi:MAG: hypothetical protein IJV68_08070 [Clostridia bacterium]|nr:hypothetical protein [Clostridia bacterium]